MVDADPIARREKRVLGVFFLMLGAGLIVDAGLIPGGTALILFGLGFLVRGVSRGQASTDSEPAAVAAPHLDR